MQGVKIVLTDEQVSWFIENFPKLPNAEICERIGCKESFVHRLARQHRLKKGESFIKWREDKAREGSRAYYRVHKQKGRPECLRPYQFKKGDSPKEMQGEEKFRETIRKSVEARKETVRLERARIAFGLEQRTKMKLKRQPRAKIWARYYLKKKGYIIDDVNLVAFYTEDTDRAFKMEASPRRFYSFRPFAKAENQ